MTGYPPALIIVFCLPPPTSVKHFFGRFLAIQAYLYRPRKPNYSMLPFPRDGIGQPTGVAAMTRVVYQNLLDETQQLVGVFRGYSGDRI